MDLKAFSKLHSLSETHGFAKQYRNLISDDPCPGYMSYSKNNFAVVQVLEHRYPPY